MPWTIQKQAAGQASALQTARKEVGGDEATCSASESGKKRKAKENVLKFYTYPIYSKAFGVNSENLRGVTVHVYPTFK